MAIFGIPLAPEHSTYRVVVLDLSRSHGGAPLDIVRALALESPQQSPGEHLAILGYGNGPVRWLSGFEESFELALAAARNAVELHSENAPPASGLGDVSEALESLFDQSPSSAHRIVQIFGDGRWTDAELRQAERKMRGLGAAWTFSGRLVTEPEDLRLRLAGPVPKLRSGEKLVIQVVIEGVTQEERTGVLTDGSTSVRFTKPAKQSIIVALPIDPKPGQQRLRVSLRDTGGKDHEPSNNTFTLPLSVAESLKVAVLGESSPAWQRALNPLRRLRRVSVHALSEGQDLPADAKVVVLLNAQPSPALLQQINGAVRDRGCGLLIFGGHKAFRAGGYAGTLLEELSPLSSLPPHGREIHIFMDRSGSMERDRRLARSVEAIARLARALSKKDQLQVHGFTAKVDAPIPLKPVSPAAFAVAALPDLRRWVAQGGTRMREVLPRLQRLAEQRDPDRDLLYVIVSDLQDEALDDPSFVAAMNQQIAEAQAQALILLLDPEELSVRRAESLGARWLPVVKIDQEFLLRAIEEDGYLKNAVRAELSDGGAQFGIPAVLLKQPWAAWNPTTSGEGAQLQLRARGSKAPLVAEAQRGGGKVLAVATSAGSMPGLGSVLGPWLQRLARREELAQSASLQDGELWVSLANAARSAPDLYTASAGKRWAWDEVRPLRYRAPRPIGELMREGSSAGEGLGHLTLLKGTGGVVEVPLAHLGDLEFWVPARGTGERDSSARSRVAKSPGRILRWPFVLLALIAATLVFLSPNSGPPKP